MDHPHIRVLYVDDEQNNLVTFKANFRRYFEVHTASSAEEGKEILRNHEIHILITDQKMPKVTGVQFLESITEEFPFPIRMILTGFTDLETVIEAINKGQIFRYLTKPFNVDELKTVIENAYNVYQFRRGSDDSLTKFREAFENLNDTIFIMDPQGHLKELNNFGLNLFKIHRSTLNTVYLRSLFVNEEDHAIFQKQLVEAGMTIDHPATLQDRSGNIIEALISASPISDNNVIIGYQCMIRDITRQKQAENIVIRAIIETQENERIRVGKNLHDSVGQKLAATKRFLEELALKNPELKENEVFKQSKETINNTIIELKNICFNIMPKTLEVVGLIGAVKELIAQSRIKGSLEIDFKFGEDFPALDPQLQISIFRIVQEFISNSMSHGHAKKIDLNFDHNTAELELILKDNGIGFDMKKAYAGKGMGLKNIYSRVQSYNGSISVSSETNEGTEFRIKLPVIP
jgi:PAS domain S-box-containing protein